MNILVAANEAYLCPLAVMLYSLAYHNKVSLKIYVLHFEISLEVQKEFREKIQKWGNKSVDIHFVKADRREFAGIVENRRYKQETNLRLLMLKVLPKEIDKILWLDVDIIVRGSLRALYECPDRNRCAVVCEDMFPSNEKSDLLRRIGMEHKDRYFNAGVMLLYLSNIRKVYNEDYFVSWMYRNPGKLMYQDQSVLNNCFKHRVIWAKADIYNLQLLRIDNSYESWKKLWKARIVHYNTKQKPWDKEYCGAGELLYWRYGIRVLGVGQCIMHFMNKQTAKINYEGDRESVGR